MLQLIQSYDKPQLGWQINYGHSLARGIVGCWLFNEGAGGLVFDSSLGNNIGTLTNMDPGSDWISGPDGGSALDFDGSNDYVNLGNVVDITNNQMAIVAWLQSGTQFQTKYIVAKTDGTLAKGYVIYYDNPGGGGGLRFVVGAAGAKIASSTWQFTDTNWHLAVGNYNGATAKLYVDNIERATVAATANITSASTVALNIGALSGGSSPFAGRIGLVVIYDRGLSLDEICQLYQDPYGFMTPRDTIWRFLPAQAVAPVIILRTITDSFFIADNLTRLFSGVKADDCFVSDVPQKQLHKTLADSLDLSDIVSAARLASLVLTDTQHVTDTTIKLLQKVLAEAEDVNDVSLKTLFKDLADNQDVSDVDSLVLVKLLSDSVFVSDSLFRVFLKAVQEQQDIADVLVKQIVKSIAETADVSDSAAKIIVKVLTDAVDFSDVVDSVRLLILLVTERQDVSDVYAKSLFATMTESEALSDGIVKQVHKALAESQDVRDAVQLLFVKTLVDNLAISDDIGAQKIATILLQETQHVLDTIDRTLFKSLSDSVTFTDTVTGLPVVVDVLLSILTRTRDNLGLHAGSSEHTGAIAGVNDLISRIQGSKGFKR